MLCWLRLQIAVTYDRVSSLFCRLAALPCELFSGLQSVDFVNILRRCLKARQRPCVYLPVPHDFSMWMVQEVSPM